MTSSSCTVTVFGSGSIGCYLGGLLVNAGARVQFIGRERYQKSLNECGLTLTHFARNTIRISPDTIDYRIEPDGAAGSDIVLVTVKSQDTEKTGEILGRVLDQNTLVISFQNGVGNADQLRKVMPGFNVLAAMVPFNVTSAGPGQFHCGTEGDLCIEANESLKLKQLQHFFTLSGQESYLSIDIEAVQWGKLLVNLNNALNALAGTNLYAGLVQKNYRRALALMIEEALAVLNKAGIKPEKFGKASPEKMIRILRLPNILYRLIMNRIVKIDADARSSMLDDLEAGRASEIDYLQGEIVRLANRTGQLVPINQRVLECVVKAFEHGSSPRMSANELLKLVNGDSPSAP